VLERLVRTSSAFPLPPGFEAPRITAT